MVALVLTLQLSTKLQANRSCCRHTLDEALNKCRNMQLLVCSGSCSAWVLYSFWIVCWACSEYFVSISCTWLFNSAGAANVSVAGEASAEGASVTGVSEEGPSASTISWVGGGTAAFEDAEKEKILVCYLPPPVA